MVNISGKSTISIDKAIEMTKGMSQEEIKRIANGILHKGMSNAEIIEKAAVTTAALASAGALSDAQVEKFTTYVFPQDKLGGIIRTHNFRNDKLHVEKLNIFERVLVPLSEGNDPTVRNEVDHTKMTLQPVPVMAPMEISDDYLLENLEGKTAEDTILKVLAIRAKNNIEQLALQGNALGHARYESQIVKGGSTVNVRKDTFLALFDGFFLKARGGSIFDNLNDANMLKAFVNVYKNLPEEFKSLGMDQLGWFMSPNLWANWQYYLANKGGSNLSDSAATGGAWGSKPLGITPYELPLLPMRQFHTEHVVLTATTATALQYSPIVASEVIVTDTTLATSATAPYSQVTDYTVNATTGTIVRVSGSTITSGATVKVTYKVLPQLLLTFPKNMCIGVGYDMKAEKDRNIYRQMDLWALSMKLAYNIEEVAACSLGINIKDDLV